MKSAFKDYRSLLVSLVEEGFLSWEEVAREFIAQGSNDDSLAIIDVFANESVSVAAFVSTEVE